MLLVAAKGGIPPKGASAHFKSDLGGNPSLCQPLKLKMCHQTQVGVLYPPSTK